MRAQDDAGWRLSRLAEQGGLSIAPRLLTALSLIQGSAAFEGDGDLAAAHLVLRDVLRDLEDLRQHAEESLGESAPALPDLQALLDGE